MGQIDTRIQTGTPITPYEKDLSVALLTYTLRMAGIINGGINFDDNFNCDIVSVADTGLVDTEFSVAHGLKKVPEGYIVIGRNKAGTVYDSGGTWTTTALLLKCNVANCTLKILIF